MVEALHSLERRYAVSEAARDGCARRLKLLEAQREELRENLQRDLRRGLQHLKQHSL